MAGGDAYLNIGRGGYVRRSGPPEGRDALLFVDIAPGAELRDLRDVPHTYLAGARTIVVRCDGAEPETLSDLVRSLECKAACGILHHPISAKATLTWIAPESQDSDWYVRRARSVELQSRLEWGSAIWLPKKYHFLLPSGKHANGFVRFANALQGPDDATAVAKWLLPYVEDNSSLVADSSTMSPLLLALSIEMQRQKCEVGSLVVLDRYPNTRSDVLGALAHINDGSPVLAAISVSSSGLLRDIIDSSFRILKPERATIVTMVDTQSPVPVASADGDFIDHHTFVSLVPPSGKPLIRSWARQCDLCHDQERSALFPVDAATFDAQFPSLVRPVMPSIDDPRNNRQLWELCDKTDAITLEAKPDAEISKWRPSRIPLPIKIDIGVLLKNKDFAEHCNRRFSEIADEWKPKDATEASPWPPFDLVLIPEDDVKRPGFSMFWKVAGKRFGASDKICAIPRSGVWSAPIKARVKSANAMLAFTIGTVTGATLQHILVGVQDSRSDNKYELYGAVAHSRPAHRRTWETLHNSFAGRLIYSWLSFLPEDLSPLQEELVALEWVDPGDLSGEERKYYESRRQTCAGVLDGVLFWSSTASTRLSAHSIFGDRLGAAGTYVAVASAVQRRRNETPIAPERSVFEMAAIFRSYYDPLILCSLLRWLRPHEITWGANPVEAETVVKNAIDRTAPGSRPMLVAELLLAAALGKVPAAAREVVRAEADLILQRRGGPKAAVRLAMRIDEAATVKTKQGTVPAAKESTKSSGKKAPKVQAAG